MKSNNTQAAGPMNHCSAFEVLCFRGMAFKGLIVLMAQFYPCMKHTWHSGDASVVCLLFPYGLKSHGVNNKLKRLDYGFQGISESNPVLL